MRPAPRRSGQGKALAPRAPLRATEPTAEAAAPSLLPPTAPLPERRPGAGSPFLSRALTALSGQPGAAAHPSFPQVGCFLLTFSYNDCLPRRARGRSRRGGRAPCGGQSQALPPQSSGHLRVSGRPSDTDLQAGRSDLRRMFRRARS